MADSQSQDFLLAHQRAQSRMGDAAWKKSTAPECTKAIYRELRALDNERVLATVISQVVRS
jgi:hypothetical protein